MKLLLKKGVTSQTALVLIQDKTQTDGRGLAGLAYNSINDHPNRHAVGYLLRRQSPDVHRRRNYDPYYA